MASKLIDAGLLDYCCECRMANSGGTSWKRRFFLNAATARGVSATGSLTLQRSSRCVMDWLPYVSFCCETWTTGFAEVSSGKSKQPHFPKWQIHHLGNRLDTFFIGAISSFLDLFGSDVKKPTFVADFFRESHSIPSRFLGHFSMNWPILSSGEADGPQVMNRSNTKKKGIDGGYLRLGGRGYTVTIYYDIIWLVVWNIF